MLDFELNEIHNLLSGMILQATSENANLNGATLQTLQHTTVAAVDQLAAIQNGQNNDSTTVHSIQIIIW